MARYTQMVKVAQEHTNNDYGFEYIGIRAQEVSATVGDIVMHCSYIWDDGDQTEELLDGVCAMNINNCQPNVHLYSYPGKYIVVLGCEQADDGEDYGEIIMIQPTVLAVYECDE